MEAILQPATGYFGRLAYRARTVLRAINCRLGNARWAYSEFLGDLAVVSEVRLRAASYKLLSFLTVFVRPGQRGRRARIAVAVALAVLVIIIAPANTVLRMAFYSYSEAADAPVIISESLQTVAEVSAPLVKTLGGDRLLVSSPEQAASEAEDSGVRMTQSLDDSYEQYSHLIGEYRTFPVSAGTAELSADDFDSAEFPEAESLMQDTNEAYDEFSPVEDSFTDSIPLTDLPAPAIAGLNLDFTEDSLEQWFVLGAVPLDTDNAEAEMQPESSGRLEDLDDDTTPFPLTESTGSYIWPAHGTLASRFGPRRVSIGSANHQGIDIGGESGQSIYAADGGEVIFSGWSDSFGYYIKIRHDNGHETIYAHCKSLLVRVGVRVWQGQEIALMGTTGISSGVHLHFELIINGRNVDPLRYLPED